MKRQVLMTRVVGWANGDKKPDLCLKSWRCRWPPSRSTLFLLFGVLCCGPLACQTQTGVPTHMAQAELMSLIQMGQPPIILDVRTAREYNRGHVPGAIRVPFYAINKHLDKLPEPRDQPVVVYCTHGLRAGIARFSLQRAGFEQVVYLEGHMLAWRRAKLPIERFEKKATSSGHP